MKILAFDTGTEYCSSALWLDGELSEYVLHAGQTHSQHLLPQCQRLLADAGVALTDLDGIAFGMGPGSFTGLRIACAVAQGLAFATDLPVIGVNSLEAMAAASGSDKVIACLDARMGEVYHAVYRYEAGEWRVSSEPGVCRPEMAPLLPGDGWLGCGSGFAAYPAALAQRYGAALAAVAADIYPSARQIAALAAPQFAQGRGRAAEAVAPLYIRDRVALKVFER